MFEVTNTAVALLKAAKSAQGVPGDAGIRIRSARVSQEREDHGTIAIGFAISEQPEPGDEAFEQDGLRIFVEDTLIEPLDGRTLDVRDANEGTELVFR